MQNNYKNPKVKRKTVEKCKYNIMCFEEGVFLLIIDMQLAKIGHEQHLAVTNAGVS